MADKIPLMDDNRAMFARKNATLTGLHSQSAKTLFNNSIDDFKAYGSFKSGVDFLKFDHKT